MSIHEVTRDRTFKIAETKQSLRPGQIVEGRILKLYPNNKAQIKLGQQVMIAQLEASLTLGERYHFQVEETEDMTRLKVLGESLIQKTSTNTVELMKVLNLKVNKNTIYFVQELLKQGISFERNQVMKAFQMIDNSNNKRSATNVLLEMISQKLPLENSIYQAVLSKQTTTISEQISTLLQHLRNIKKPTATEQNLIHQLSQISEGPTWNKKIFMQFILDDISTKNQPLFQLLKAGGIVAANENQVNWNNEWLQFKKQLHIPSRNESEELPNQLFKQLATNQLFQPNIPRADFITALNTFLKKENIVQLGNMSTNELQRMFDHLKATQIMRQSIDFSTWKSHLKTFLAASGGQLLHNSEQRLSYASLPYMQDMDQIMSTLTHLHHTPRIKQAAVDLINNWANTINKAIIQNQLLDANEFTQLGKEIKDQLSKYLLPEQQHLFNQMNNNKSDLRHMLTTLQGLANEDANAQLDKLMTSMNNANRTTALKENFLIQLKQSLSNMGLSHENQVTNDVKADQGATIKSMLIDMINTQDVRSERLQPLLHLINGLQLQSVQEVGSFIQASIQVPGGPLALNGDLFLKFESQKTEDGKVDPDFCRILFYLDLESLKETIIDMHIQKRTVKVTIYNDRDNLKEHTTILEPMMKEGLAKLDYNLSTVLVKKLKEESTAKKPLMTESFHETHEGYDVKI